MILAGDIGGTKTNLALFSQEEGDYTFSNLKKFPSQEYKDLRTIVGEYLESCKQSEGINMACFAIAGPVKEGICRATNLPWIVDAQALSRALNIPTVYLINDLEANAYSIEILSPENILEIHSGNGNFQGNRCVVSPGTGLGEAGLFWDGKLHHPFASEGGHCDFAPRSELQIDFCRYLYRRFGHGSYERALSGPGLVNIYDFFRDEKKIEEPTWLYQEMKKEDPAKVITINALEKKSSLCETALDFFATILGAECSNSVLKYMALGGVYLGGGIPPKILVKLKEPVFYEGFLDKGRFRGLLEEVPIRVILDDKASLKGAAHYCRLQSTHHTLL
ncbi:MAG: glucokinase [Chlamydiales bacterium]|nr:glucokinase [Chlamydiales bacterium]